MYRRLDPTHIVVTAERLSRRIAERFPDSGLLRVSGELVRVTREAQEISEYLARPNLAVRFAVGIAIALVLGVLGAALTGLRFEARARDWSETLQGLEALVNDGVFVGVAVYFLLGLEVRLKRRRTLSALHVLRSLAHIVDMHQLTKDPERVSPLTPRDTPSSPVRTLTPFELERYLDYSSEMLAIISKIAALYVQESTDPVTVDAASAVEDLAVGLSRTIWQKIMILERRMPAGAPRSAELAG